MQIHLAGGSHVQTWNEHEHPKRGWGEFLTDYLPPEIPVHNRARGGSSTRVFFELFYANLLRAAGPGDLILFAFGTVDEMLHSGAFHVSQREFRLFLDEYVHIARELGVRPAFVTPVARCAFTPDGKPRNTLRDYPDIMREQAAALGIPLIDVYRHTLDCWSALGPVAARSRFAYIPAGVHPNYPDGVLDATHLNEYGSREVAAFIAAELHRSGVIGSYNEPAVRSLEKEPLPYYSMGWNTELSVKAPLQPPSLTGEVSVTKPQNKALVSPMIIFTGTAPPGAGHVLFLRGDDVLGSAPVSATGTWMWRRPVSWNEGEHRIQVVAYQRGRTFPAAHLTFTVQASVAPPQIHTPRRASGPRPVFTGTAPAGTGKVVLTENGRRIGEAKVRDGAWKWADPHNWQPGRHTVQATGICFAHSSPPADVTFTVIGIPDDHPLSRVNDARIGCIACDTSTDENSKP